VETKEVELVVKTKEVEPVVETKEVEPVTYVDDVNSAVDSDEFQSIIDNDDVISNTDSDEFKSTIEPEDVRSSTASEDFKSIIDTDDFQSIIDTDEFNPNMNFEQVGETSVAKNQESPEQVQTGSSQFESEIRSISKVSNDVSEESTIKSISVPLSASNAEIETKLDTENEAKLGSEKAKVENDFDNSDFNSFRFGLAPDIKVLQKSEETSTEGPKTKNRFRNLVIFDFDHSIDEIEHSLDADSINDSHKDGKTSQNKWFTASSGYENETEEPLSRSLVLESPIGNLKVDEGEGSSNSKEKSRLIDLKTLLSHKRAWSVDTGLSLQNTTSTSTTTTPVYSITGSQSITNLSSMLPFTPLRATTSSSVSPASATISSANATFSSNTANVPNIIRRNSLIAVRSNKGLFSFLSRRFKSDKSSDNKKK
ncbi:uncharacterized protein ASCRUDRAFT_6325, partial [Ascoidea rubescens DSM 1968]